MDRFTYLSSHLIDSGGWKSGLLDRGNGFHRSALDVCNQEGTHCIQGYEDAFKIKQTAYWQGYEMGLQDLKARIHQQDVDACNHDDIEGKLELQCIQGYNDAIQSHKVI